MTNQGSELLIPIRSRETVARWLPQILRELPGRKPGTRVRVTYHPTPDGVKTKKTVVPEGNPNRPYLFIPGFGTMSEANLHEVADYLSTKPQTEKPKRDFRGVFLDYMDWKMTQFKRNPSLLRELYARRDKEAE